MDLLWGAQGSVCKQLCTPKLEERVIEEGIVARGVKEICEEGCRILSEMERGGIGNEGREGMDRGRRLGGTV